MRRGETTLFFYHTVDRLCHGFHKFVLVTLRLWQPNEIVGEKRFKLVNVSLLHVKLLLLIGIVAQDVHLIFQTEVFGCVEGEMHKPPSRHHIHLLFLLINCSSDRFAVLIE